MGQALYRKYRSKSLQEVVGQEHVTTTLSNALKQGKISHAYLLSGPRGVGKTSIARILAHEINGLPYDDQAHLDIIEIDAASNRRIDEIRDLRDRVNTAPAHAKYKVYIIDEVHMLTKEAFNALLKTLEEPPAHVVFILATTEAHKLPDTIISRTQRYSLRPVAEKQVIAHLKEIAKGEKLKIDDDALQLVAQHGEGSFRDSISLLDQASSTSEHVTKADVERILGLAPDESIRKLMTALQSADTSSVVNTLTDLQAQGFEAAMIAQQLSSQVRTEILNEPTGNVTASLALLRALLDVPAARNPKQLLEIVLLQTALPPQPIASSIVVPTAATSKPTATPEPATIPAPEPRPEPILEPTPPPLEVPDKTSVEEEALDKTTLQDAIQTTAAAAATQDVTELWKQALDEIKKQYNTLYGIARMAEPTFDGETLTLSFKFSFHQKRINEVKNRQIFADVMERLYGKPVQIVCIIAESSDTATPKPDVAAISNIFGGAELLQ